MPAKRKKSKYRHVVIRNKKYIFNSISRIANMFPQYCDMYVRKTTGNAELRLRDKTK